jgi:hypothetical protein
MAALNLPFGQGDQQYDELFVAIKAKLAEYLKEFDDSVPKYVRNLFCQLHPASRREWKQIEKRRPPSAQVKRSQCTCPSVLPLSGLPSLWTGCGNTAPATPPPALLLRLHSPLRSRSRSRPRHPSLSLFLSRLWLWLRLRLRQQWEWEWRDLDSLISRLEFTSGCCLLQVQRRDLKQVVRIGRLRRTRSRKSKPIEGQSRASP